jgi:hypothetical protein
MSPMVGRHCAGLTLRFITRLTAPRDGPPTSDHGWRTGQRSASPPARAGVLQRRWHRCSVSPWPTFEASLDEGQKPRQDFLDVFAELARLTFGHISTQVWHGSVVQPQQIQCPVLHGSHSSGESDSLRICVQYALTRFEGQAWRHAVPAQRRLSPRQIPPSRWCSQKGMELGLFAGVSGIALT